MRKGILMPALALVSTGATAQWIVGLGYVRQASVRCARLWDVRDAASYAKGHIPDAVNIPFGRNWVDPDTCGKLCSGAVKDSAGMALKPREQLIALYEKLDPAIRPRHFGRDGGVLRQPYADVPKRRAASLRSCSGRVGCLTCWS